MTIITTVVDCLRHGEVEGGGRFRGATDDALTPKGWQQMSQQCAETEWDQIVSSPLRRCREFAAALAQQQQLPLNIDSSWAEIDFGVWEGKTSAQIERQFPGVLSAYYDDPVTTTPADAEPYQNFALRIQQAWEQTIAEFAGQRLLLVTHAGPIRALLSNLLMISPQNSFHIDMPHACLTRLSCFQHAENSFVQLNFIKPL